MHDLLRFEDAIVSKGDLIWVKPLCDFFDLDARNQHKKIKKDPILSNLVGKNTPDSNEIDKNGRILLTKKGFLRWVQIINPNTVREDLRKDFIAFQSLVFDMLFGSFEQKEYVRSKYARLKKLKRLYGKIGNAIAQEQAVVRKYVDQDLGQMRLDV